jgi:hypothetical protein
MSFETHHRRKIEGGIQVTGRQGYWIILGKGEDTVNLKRKPQIALCGELALEGAVDLS